MKVAISVESTNDLSKELLEKYDISVIPFEITLGDMTFLDGEHTTEEMFEFVDTYKTLPKTTAINEFKYTEYFKSLREEYDGVIHIALSSGITSSCGNAERAGKNVDNVFVVDSKSLSTGIGLLAIYAREESASCSTVEELFNKVNDRVKSLQVSFVIERLDYLYKGGRCSSLQLFGANLLKIRPRIVLRDGKMINDSKYRGKMEMVVAKYCDDILAQFDKPDLKRVFITYTSATPEMVDAAKDACKRAGFKEILETKAGGTIASHCGAHTLGILYFNDGE